MSTSQSAIFELYDKTNTTREALIGGLIRAVETEELVGIHTLEIDLIPYDMDRQLSIGVSGSDYGIMMPKLLPQKYLRMRLVGTGVTKYFIIRTIEKMRERGEYIIKLICEHHKYALLDQVIPRNFHFHLVSSQSLLAEAFSYVTGFSIGTNEIPVTEYRSVQLEHPTALGVLKYVCDNWTQEVSGEEKRFYYQVADSGTITIKREDNIGSTIEYPFTYAHSLLGITRTMDAPINRLYHSGLDNSIVYSRNKRYVDTSAGSYLLAWWSGSVFQQSETYTLNDAGGDANPVAAGSIVLMQTHCAVGGSWSSGAGYFTVTVKIEQLSATDAVLAVRYVKLSNVTYADRVIGKYDWHLFEVGDLLNVKKVRLTTWDIDFFGGADPSAVSVAKTQINYQLAPNAAYVEDTVSQSTYGVIGALVENREHPLVINEWRDWKIHGGAQKTMDSDLSGTYGTYVSGLNDTLTIIGTATPSANTNPLYIIEGTKSQKIVTALGDSSLMALREPPPALIAGRSYHLIVTLYIESGSLYVSLLDRHHTYSGALVIFRVKTEGIGWVQLVSETSFGTDTTGSWDFGIIDADGGSVYYLDSVCLAMSTEKISYYKENSADILYNQASRLVKLNANPKIIYEANVIDLARVDPHYAGYRYAVGDNVTVRDTELGIDQQLKIYRRTRDLLLANDDRLTLADRKVSMAEMVNVISDSKTIRGL